MIKEKTIIGQNEGLVKIYQQAVQERKDAKRLIEAFFLKYNFEVKNHAKAVEEFTEQFEAHTIALNTIPLSKRLDLHGVDLNALERLEMAYNVPIEKPDFNIYLAEGLDAEYEAFKNFSDSFNVLRHNFGLSLANVNLGTAGFKLNLNQQTNMVEPSINYFSSGRVL